MSHTPLYWWLITFAALAAIGHLRIPTPFSSVGLMSVFYCAFIGWALITLYRHDPAWDTIRSSVMRYPLLYGAGTAFYATLLVNALRTDTLHGWGITIEWFALPTLAILALHWLLTLRHTQDRDNDREQEHTTHRYATEIAQITLVGISAFLAATLPAILVGYRTYDGRLTALWQSPNELALALAPWILTGLWAALMTRGTLRLIMCASSLAALLILRETASLGAIAALTITAMCMIIFHTWHRRRAHTTSHQGSSAALVIITLLTTIALVGITLNEKWHAAYHTDGRTPLDSRIMIWHATADILRSAPLTGIPIGTFQETYLDYQEHYPPYLEWAVPHPHNTALYLWITTGWIGLTAALVILTTLFYHALQTKRSALALLLTLFIFTGILDLTL